MHLRNPEAADKLVADVYEAIDRTLAHPLVTAPKYCPPDVRQPYYAIQIRNYTVFYVVHDHVMEVRWFRYSPIEMDMQGILDPYEFCAEDVLADSKEKLLYSYDYGDGWKADFRVGVTTRAPAAVAS